MFWLFLLAISLLISCDSTPQDPADQDDIIQVAAYVWGKAMGDGKLIPSYATRVSGFKIKLYPLGESVPIDSTRLYDIGPYTFKFTDVPYGDYRITLSRTYLHSNWAYSEYNVQVDDSITVLPDTLFLDSLRYDYFPLGVGNRYLYGGKAKFYKTIDPGFLWETITDSLSMEMVITGKTAVATKTVYAFDKTTTRYWSKTHISGLRWVDSLDTYVPVDSTNINRSITVVTEQGTVVEEDGFITSEAFFTYPLIYDSGLAGYHLLHPYDSGGGNYAPISKGPTITVMGRNLPSIRYGYIGSIYYCPEVGPARHVAENIGNFISRDSELNLLEYELGPKE